jgi:hypothetical protein
VHDCALWVTELTSGSVTSRSYDRSMDQAALVVDTAPAQVVTDADLHDWGTDQHVFISSVMANMSEEREAAASAVDRIGATAVCFERFGGRDDDPEQAYLSEVARSDIYLGILGERYGTPLPSGYSATHAEYREAIRRGLRISVWVLDGQLAGPQRDFVDEVRVFRTTGSYKTAEDLARGTEARLRSLAAEALSPWVKVGEVIFRARSVHFDGKTFRAEARVRDDRVVAALEGLRPGGIWRGAHDVRVTWAGRSDYMTIKSVETQTAAGRGSVVTIVADTASPPAGRPAFVDMALSNRSPEDLGELAIRISLFGEPNPLGSMGFMAKMTNPFPIIELLGVAEDAVHPIAHLLLTEDLISSGRADRITSLQVGPKRGGSRRVTVAWQPRRRYTNLVPEERLVDGEVDLTRRP